MGLTEGATHPSLPLERGDTQAARSLLEAEAFTGDTLAEERLALHDEGDVDGSSRGQTPVTPRRQAVDRAAGGRGQRPDDGYLSARTGWSRAEYSDFDLGQVGEAGLGVGADQDPVGGARGGGDDQVVGRRGAARYGGRGPVARAWCTATSGV
jgi:hypothetical protein